MYEKNCFCSKIYQKYEINGKNEKMNFTKIQCISYNFRAIFPFSLDKIFLSSIITHFQRISLERSANDNFRGNFDKNMRFFIRNEQKIVKHAQSYAVH